MKWVTKKILLGASWSIIEPLGLFFLSSIAKQEGWEPKIILTKEPDFLELETAMKEFKPDLLGFTVYTGNHHDVAKFFRRAKAQNNALITIAGGPHATYFPKETLGWADYVVLSKGLNSFRRILREEVKSGIIHPIKFEDFPVADREDFYRDNLKHRDNLIKNIVTKIGCPYSCTYCYNCSTLNDVDGLNPQQKKEMGAILGPLGKLFPLSNRLVDDVIKEVEEIQRFAPKTKMIFFQDDIFGINMEWLREFVKKWERKLEFHAQMRFEFADPKKAVCRERLKLMREAGCTGLTFAIESPSDIIRKEILNRHMDNELMFRVLDYVSRLGFSVRTEQILGLPRSATTKPTKVNLDADLDTLKLNVELKEETGLPTIAWASTLAPYPGTKIAEHCAKHGFYRGNHEGITKEGYRTRSVLNFPKTWVGPNLTSESKEWMSEGEQEDYKDKLNLLMNYFSIFALIPKGHDFAREFLKQKDTSPEALIRATENFRHIPKGDELAKAFLNQDNKTPAKFNELVRFHLYDYELYQIKK